MSKSIVERVFGALNPYTSNYLDATMRLTKSIVVHCSLEATKFNELVMLKYKIRPNKFDKSSWRYYKHLNGDYHRVDVPMKIHSLDNREEITITKESMKVHVDTLRELQLFGSLYDEVIEAYPEQDLLLRSIMMTSDRMSVKDLVDLKDWEIVGYNKSLIEEQETDLLLSLQKRIENFSVKNMLMGYDATNSLYLAVMFCTLYDYIYKTLLGLRLKNVKTNRVHSYHLLSYLASHHELDSVYDYLDTYQRMFLYRNLLYLDSHAGKNSTLETLVDVFFDRKRMMVTNYNYRQLSGLRDDLSTEYGFVQRLLNKTRYSYPKEVFDLNELSKKEMLIHPNNSKEYEFNVNEMDFKLTNSLNTVVNTKDLEVTINDETNTVRHKLIDITLDYWAVTTELGYNESIVNLTDPVSGKDLFLNSKEAYRLYQIAILRFAGFDCPNLPDGMVGSAFTDEEFDPEVSLTSIMKRWWYVEDEIKEIYVQRPRYIYLQTRTHFRNFIEKVYRYELGMSVFLDNESELYSRYDIEKAYEDLHKSYVIHNDNINIKSFLHKLEIEEMYDYSQDNLMIFANALLDKATDGVLGANELYRLTQEAVLKILSKFKSYTTQILNNFFISNRRIVGPFTTRLSIPMWSESHKWVMPAHKDMTCVDVTLGSYHRLRADEFLKVTNGVTETILAGKNKAILTNVDVLDTYGISNGKGCIILDEGETTPDTVLTTDDLIKVINTEE